MSWTKLGRVYVAGGEAGWAQTHAALPTALALDDETIRVYVAFLDADQVGRIGYVDVAAKDPLQVLDVSAQPIVDIGDPGMFDDHGVNPLSVCRSGEAIHLYYAGWQLGVTVRYYLFQGLAVSRDGGETFIRHARVPVLDRSDAEPVLRSSGHVQAGDPWRIWYAGGDSWTDAGDRPRPRYDLRYLESPDGIEWGPEGEVCISSADEDEFGFARPHVIERDGLLRMWYSVRTISSGYRIGYAESADGRTWDRRDHEAGIDVSEQGWDSEMICYPNIAQTAHGTYLFYNGNDYGRTGFGVAVAGDA